MHSNVNSSAADRHGFDIEESEFSERGLRVNPVTITAADVQNICYAECVCGDFDAVEDALTSNTAYVNVHTTNLPAGEIRGQIHRGEADED